MSGVLALVGGSEHTPGCEETDRWLLSSVGARRPHVAVLLAASPRRRRAFKQDEAVTWWRQLGADVRCAYAGEDEPLRRALSLLAGADIIVLTGGRPWLLQRHLDTTPLGKAVRTRWREGAAVVGSSAGAMALAEWAWSLRPAELLRPRRGLGFAPALLVAPHAGRHGIDVWASWTQLAHPEIEVLGLPDRTSLLIGPDGSRTVCGVRPVATYSIAHSEALVGGIRSA